VNYIEESKKYMQAAIELMDEGNESRAKQSVNCANNLLLVAQLERDKQDEYAKLALLAFQENMPGARAMFKFFGVKTLLEAFRDSFQDGELDINHEAVTTALFMTGEQPPAA
jgi:hypothetical protein